MSLLLYYIVLLYNNHFDVSSNVTRHDIAMKGKTLGKEMNKIKFQ